MNMGTTTDVIRDGLAPQVEDDGLRDAAKVVREGYDWQDADCPEEYREAMGIILRHAEAATALKSKAAIPADRQKALDDFEAILEYVTLPLTEQLAVKLEGFDPKTAKENVRAAIQSPSVPREVVDDIDVILANMVETSDRDGRDGWRKQTLALLGGKEDP